MSKSPTAQISLAILRIYCKEGIYLQIIQDYFMVILWFTSIKGESDNQAESGTYLARTTRNSQNYGMELGTMITKLGNV